MKKKLLKFIAFLFLFLFLGIMAGIIYLTSALPNVGEPEKITIKSNDSIIKHGKYLAYHVMLCMDCHSVRDWNTFSAPPIAGTLGQGGEIFNQQMGFPGTYISPNITPYNLKNWTDGEILRAVTTGVTKDGEALFQIMPYTHYGKASKSDIEAVIAYIRTLPSIKKEHPDSSSDFPVNLLINTMPQKADFCKIPTDKNSVAYGAYLVNLADCANCHTKQEQGKVTGKPFAGGFQFNLPNGTIVRSANITPDATGIKNWTEEQFLQRFKMYADSSKLASIGKGDFQSVMPWNMYAGMTDADLKAIFKYLKTLEPIENKVVKFETY